jgi:putative endopeptidase
MNRKNLFISFCTAVLILACIPFATAQTPSATHGISIQNLDPSVRPGDDFYHYANGGFIARTKLPADRASIGVFSVLSDRSSRNIQSIIEDAAKANAPADSNEGKIAALYRSYMDETAIEANGRTSLKPHLADIAAISSAHELARALGLSVRADVDPLNNTNFATANIFGLWVAPSFNDPDHYAPYLLQGGLELPNREYYLDHSANMKGIRTKYLRHVSAMLRLAGLPHSEARARRVLSLETAIAQQQISLADSENIHKANNPWKPADFSSKAPGMDWAEFLKAAKLDQESTIIVWQPAAIAGEAALVSSQPLDAWKDLLTYHLIEEYAAGTSKALADERFDFFGRTINGTTEQRPRAYRGAIFVSGMLGDAVGEIYAKRYFSPEGKAQAEELVHNLLAAFRMRLENVTWMAPATKKEALAKLASLQIGIGYPDHFRSYAELEVKPDDLFGNMWRGDLFEYRYSLGRIGKRVDRKEWCMTPQTVNAVNLPLDNGLNFPAAILQPPFFDPKAPAAANYGAIGTIIGHEISHTFDSEGAAFDAKGRVRNWWTDEDLAHFESVTAALAAQYDSYKVFPDLAVHGRQTLGENIADVAGLTAAFDAVHVAEKEHPGSTIDGFTPDQQFFIAFGQNWGSVSREEALRKQVLTDPHAPAQFRADTVRNIDGWYTTFSVKPKEKLYLPPSQRVHIW